MSSTEQYHGRLIRGTRGGFYVSPLKKAGDKQPPTSTNGQASSKTGGTVIGTIVAGPLVPASPNMCRTCKLNSSTKKERIEHELAVHCTAEIKKIVAAERKLEKTSSRNSSSNASSTSSLGRVFYFCIDCDSPKRFDSERSLKAHQARYPSHKSQRELWTAKPKPPKINVSTSSPNPREKEKKTERKEASTKRTENLSVPSTKRAPSPAPPSPLHSPITPFSASSTIEKEKEKEKDKQTSIDTWRKDVSDKKMASDARSIRSTIEKKSASDSKPPVPSDNKAQPEKTNNLEVNAASDRRPSTDNRATNDSKTVPSNDKTNLEVKSTADKRASSETKRSQPVDTRTIGDKKPEPAPSKDKKTPEPVPSKDKKGLEPGLKDRVAPPPRKDTEGKSEGKSLKDKFKMSIFSSK